MLGRGEDGSVEHRTTPHVPREEVPPTCRLLFRDRTKSDDRGDGSLVVGMGERAPPDDAGNNERGEVHAKHVHVGVRDLGLLHGY